MNNQPVIRLDYQPFQSLRTTFKYSGERQRRQTFPGTLAGFNDTQTHDPVVTTTALTVNYSLNATTFIEANYGYGRNAVAGCVDIFTNCTASIMMSPASDKRTTGLGDLPMLFPDGVNMDPALLRVRAAHEDEHADVPERHDPAAADVQLGATASRTLRRACRIRRG